MAIATLREKKSPKVIKLSKQTLVWLITCSLMFAYRRNMNFKFIALKMESCCSFKALVGGVCGYDPKDRKRDSEIVPLLSCDKDINRHKSLYKLPGLKMRLS